MKINKKLQLIFFQAMMTHSVFTSDTHIAMETMETNKERLFHLIRDEQANPPQETIDFITRNPELIHARNSFNQTPLEVAISAHNPQAMKALIDLGADVKEKELIRLAGRIQNGGKSKSPAKHLLLLQILLDAGADVNVRSCNYYRDSDSNSIWFHSCKSNCLNETLLHKAVFLHNLPMVQLLLSAGANYTLTDGYGKTPEEYTSGVFREQFLQAIPSYLLK